MMYVYVKRFCAFLRNVQLAMLYIHVNTFLCFSKKCAISYDVHTCEYVLADSLIIL